MTSYIDIHSHLFFKDYDQDLGEVLGRMEEHAVTTITVGTDFRTSTEAVRLAEQTLGMYATVGLHPTHAGEETFNETKYKELADSPKVVGVGECGLDYYRRDGNDKEVKETQIREFEKHMEFAISRNLPLMIHARPSKGTVDAYQDVAALIRSRQKTAGDTLRGNMHFFVGDVDTARTFYTLGFTTSFTGVVTFARDYDEVIRFAPLDMLLTETDAPFVAPEPFRGRRNEPAYVTYVVEALARIRGEDVERVRRSSVENAARVFKVA